MAVLQNPLQHMTGDEEMTRYVGVLERRLIMLTIKEVRFRALLESLTGEPWDDEYEDLDQAEMDELVEKSLVKSLGVTKMEASKMVRAHKARANSRNIVDDPNLVKTLPASSNDDQSTQD